jgi:hypothetical protein
MKIWRLKLSHLLFLQPAKLKNIMRYGKIVNLYKSSTNINSNVEKHNHNVSERYILFSGTGTKNQRHYPCIASHFWGCCMS